MVTGEKSSSLLSEWLCKLEGFWMFHYIKKYNFSHFWEEGMTVFPLK